MIFHCDAITRPCPRFIGGKRFGERPFYKLKTADMKEEEENEKGEALLLLSPPSPDRVPSRYPSVHEWLSPFRSRIGSRRTALCEREGAEEKYEKRRVSF